MRNYPAFPRAIPHRQGRFPTCSSPVRHGYPRKSPVRLACIRHAASVDPEPGSNSPPCLSCCLSVSPKGHGLTGSRLCAARTSVPLMPHPPRQTTSRTASPSSAPQPRLLTHTPPSHQLLKVRLAQSAPALSLKGTAKSTMRSRWLSNARGNTILVQIDRPLVYQDWPSPASSARGKSKPQAWLPESNPVRLFRARSCSAMASRC